MNQIYMYFTYLNTGCTYQIDIYTLIMYLYKILLICYLGTIVLLFQRTQSRIRVFLEFELVSCCLLLAATWTGHLSTWWVKRLANCARETKRHSNSHWLRYIAACRSTEERSCYSWPADYLLPPDILSSFQKLCLLLAVYFLWCVQWESFSFS